MPALSPAPLAAWTCPSDAVGEQKSTKLWAHPLLLAGVALAFDAVDLRVPFNILSTGLFDEPTHLATAVLGVLVPERFIDVPRRFYVAALIASVAIDLNHIPFTSGYPRAA